MYVESFIPFVLSVLSFSGAVVLLFKAPRRWSTLLLSSALLALSAKEGMASYFFSELREWAIFLFLVLEIPFVGLWSSGLLLCFSSKTVYDRWTTLSVGGLLVAAGALTAATLIHPKGFFFRSEDAVGIVFLGPLGMLHALYLLLPSLFLLWRLEGIFRQSTEKQRWLIKYPILGTFVVSGVMIWQAGYRLTYRIVPTHQLSLFSAITFIGIGLFLFFVIRHKLFHIKIFISRYVVYRSFALTVFGLYLLGLGLTGFGVRYLGYSLPFLVKWLFIFATGLCAIVLFMSKDVRKRVKHYINTHFFENKYDYRYEWVKFSSLLSRATTLHEVLSSLDHLIRDSMFVSDTTVWFGNDKTGYVLYDGYDARFSELQAEDAFVEHMKEHPYFLPSFSRQNDEKPVSQVLKTSEEFISRHHIELAAPLACANEFFGFVALGGEKGSASFNQDDLDLITALCSQAAVSIMSIRLAEEVSNARELAFINKVNLFVMHDLKNAAALLSLLTQSAPEHIGKPEFQTDLLEAIENAHGRIEKAMKRLKAPETEQGPEMSPLVLSEEVSHFCNALADRWPGIHIDCETQSLVKVKGSPALIRNILENLFLNAKEAMDQDGTIRVRVRENAGDVSVEVSDTGVGIQQEFAKTKMFKPLQTTKDQGLGIGLWQVRHNVEEMNGTITVHSEEKLGTTFTISFPALQEQNMD